MRLTPPKNMTFWISVLLGVLGFVGKILSVPVLAPFAFWLVFVGLVLVVLGLLLKGL